MNTLTYTTTVDVPGIVRFPVRLRVQGTYTTETSLTLTHVSLEGDTAREDLLHLLTPLAVACIRLQASERLLHDLEDLNATA